MNAEGVPRRGCRACRDEPIIVCCGVALCPKHAKEHREEEHPR